MEGTLEGSHSHCAGRGAGTGLFDLASDLFFESALIVGNNRFENGPRSTRNAKERGDCSTAAAGNGDY